MYRKQIAHGIETDWFNLLFWVSALVLANLFHFDRESMQFTFDLPLLLAVGALYHPAVAAAVAFTGIFDVREVSRRISLTRAVFNRAQAALGVFLASTTFHVFTASSDSWPIALLGIGASFVVFLLLNAGVIALAIRLQGTSFSDALHRLRIGRPWEFLTTCLAYGVLALVLAFLFEAVGPWSAALFFVPIIVGHSALVRAEKLVALAGQLRGRERLLERLSDRIVDERRDERTRIASDLHDHVLQNVTKIWMVSRSIEKSSPSNSPINIQVKELVSDAEITLGSLREVISDLQKSPLGRGGLIPTLDQLVRDLKFDWPVRMKLESRLDQDVPPDLQVVAYQVAREAIVNCLKHAQASNLSISVIASESSLSVTVRDDGEGFDPDAVDSSRHFGLGLIEERLRQVDGRLKIRSELGNGTELHAEIPLGFRAGQDSSS